MGSTTTDYGHRLVAHVIDEIASSDPHREVLLTPRSSDPRDGWAVTTHASFANAINRCAWKIVEKYGKAPSGKFPTIAYIGPQDARYLVVVVAAIKAGYQALFISPRNSPQAQINLFEKTDCSILWHSDNLRPLVNSWLYGREMQTLAVQPVEEWFPTEKVAHFPYNRTFEEGQFEPLAALHTSGSTGLPKPIVVKQGAVCLQDAWQTLPPLNGSEYWQLGFTTNVKRYFIPMPLFHAAALVSFFILSIYGGAAIVLGPADRTPTADLVRDCLNSVEVQGALLPPSILEEMSLDASSVAALSKLHLVVFGGGHLAKEAGDRMVNRGVRLLNLIASTEMSLLPLYSIDRPEDWQYFHFNSDFMGAEWRPSHDGSYELVLVRKEPGPVDQAIFYTFPELSEYSSNDLYKPHPTLPNHWAYYGRADNIIVFSNGEKLNPITIEEIVTSHPEVRGAVVTGSNRFQAGLLVEPSQALSSEDEKRQFVDRIWPLIEEANRDTVAHGRIVRELVTVTKPDKPFPRAGKGSIQRAIALKTYAEEIDHLYEQAEQSSCVSVEAIDLNSQESLTDLVTGIFESLAQGAKLDPDTDFFSAGIDSLQVMNASRILRSSLTKAVPTLDPGLLGPRSIYNNPTPLQLARYIMHLVTHDGANGSDSEDAADMNVAKSLYENYTRDIPQGRPGRPEAPEYGQTVLVTGTTGHLGVYLLDQLVHKPTVSKVICLNRAGDGGAKQQQNQMRARGLTQDAHYAEKVEYLQVDLTKETFGISSERYESLLKEAHRFIHNAWPVNFNLSTESFEPYIRGVRHVADFAARAEHRVAVVFISSIGSVTHWDMNQGPVPETRLQDWSLPGNSYGRSKMAGSLVLEDAAVAGDFPAASIRVGQIAGAEADQGLWNRHEWLPSIVASSLHLGALPRELGASDRVDWVPVNRVAQLVLDVAGATPGQASGIEGISGYYHAVNSSVTCWSDLAPAVQQFYGDRIKELISFEEWVDRLEKSDAKDVETNPGFKLVDTYRWMVSSETPPLVLSLERTNRRSRAIEEAPMISPELFIKWCEQWAFA